MIVKHLDMYLKCCLKFGRQRTWIMDVFHGLIRALNFVCLFCFQMIFWLNIWMSEWWINDTQNTELNLYIQFNSVQSFDWLSHQGNMMDNSSQILFQTFLWETIVSSCGMRRDVHICNLAAGNSCKYNIISCDYTTFMIMTQMSRVKDAGDRQ